MEPDLDPTGVIDDDPDDAFNLDIVVTTKATTIGRNCLTDDGCRKTCASACVS